MNNIQIDDKIINDYLNGFDVSVYRNDEVFSLGQDPSGNNINVFTEPNQYLLEKAKLITHGFIEEIRKINFSEDSRILKYIPNMAQLESAITIKLIVGLPYGIRRMFRGGKENGIVIVIDVINGLHEDDDNDLYIEEFSNYIKYAILLMALDASGIENDDKSVETLAHAIFSASFAEYLSGTNQLEKLENLNLISFWEYSEYQIIKKVLKKQLSSDVTSYMGMVVNSNPEMIVLGITGKRYLSTFDEEEEIYKVYQDGRIEFIKNILKNKANKEAIALPKFFTLLNRSIILLILGYMFWSILGFIFGEHLYNRIFYVYPLIIFVNWLLKDWLAFKLEVKSKMKFLRSIIIIAIISIIYMLVVL